jgi:histidyl-tRNA synthetase
VDYLCEACATHFTAVRAQLDAWSIPWRLSHRLVRGLDYYTRTTFEFSARPSARRMRCSAVDGGTDSSALGGRAHRVGFAAGLERLVLALPEARAPAAPRVTSRRLATTAGGSAAALRDFDGPDFPRTWSSKRAASRLR